MAGINSGVIPTRSQTFFLLSNVTRLLNQATPLPSPDHASLYKHPIFSRIVTRAMPPLICIYMYEVGDFDEIVGQLEFICGKIVIHL